MASRRAADQLIAAGAVLVNGEVSPPKGRLIDPDVDTVTLHGKVVRPVVRHRYVILHKPIGVVTTASDESGRATVLDVIGPEGLGGHRLFPVGRLDIDTTGILLLTDDGELAHRLTHPRFKIAKEYLASVTGIPTASDMEKLRSGVTLDDGVTAGAEVELMDTGPGESVVRMVIREGRKRQVRRMLEAVGHPVKALRRTGFGPLLLGRLREGGWRLAGENEIGALKRSGGI